MISISCDVCGSGNYREICDIKISPILTPSKLVRCKECGFFYANPRQTNQEEQDFYKTRHYKEQERDFWYEGRMDVFRRAVGKIGKFIKKGRLLDLGCGMGYFMELARNNGWQVKGVDLSDYAVSYARDRLNLDVIKGALKDLRFEAEYFDVATMWNVLDQLYDPRENLLELNRLLKKGGYLFIRVTNLYFHLKLFKLYKSLRPLFKNIKNSPAIFHLYEFDKNSIEKLLESTGFSRVAVSTEPLGVNVPGFVEIFGKKNERILRRMFDLGANIVFFASFGQIVISPSIFVTAQK